jgi:ankyrin repeat protein
VSTFNYTGVSNSISLDETSQLNSLRHSSALLTAINTNNIKMCASLLEAGIDIDLPLSNKCGCCTSLTIALDLKKYEVATFLIDQGASISVEGCSQRPVTHGWTPFHYAVLDDSYCDVLQSLLKRLPDWSLIDSPIHPLHIAVASRKDQALKTVLEHHVKFYDKPSTEHGIPSQWERSSRVNQESLSSLLNVKIQMSDVRWKWSLGLRPRENIENLDSKGTLLHTAVEVNEINTAEILLRYGASVDSLDDFQRTPLSIAAEFGRLDMVTLLLRHGADVNARDLDLETPAMKAAKQGYDKIVHELKKAGADFTIQDVLGRTALGHGVTGDNPAVLMHLLEDRYSLHQHDEDGELYSVIAFFNSSTRMRTYILNTDLDLTAHTKTKGNLFHGLADQGSKRFVKHALRRVPACDVVRLLNIRSEPANSALYVAAKFGSVDIISMFLDAGADIEFEGGQFGTPLMVACEAGNIETVRLLVRRGAKISYSRGSHESISGVTLARRYPAVVRWLLVSRHTAQGKLCEVADASTAGLESKMWAGFQQVEIPRPRPYGVSWFQYLTERNEARERYFGRICHSIGMPKLRRTTSSITPTPNVEV